MTRTLGHETAASCWTTAYWLGNCEGYQVYEGGTRIGYVDAVLEDEGAEHSLLVRVGELFTHLVAFPAASVEAIDPVEERVYVALSVPAVDEQLRIPALV